jgi:predicted oxidoreductase (fatty acid repression mutant protein)
MGIIDTAADRDAIYAAVKQLTRCANSLDTIAVALVKLSLDQPSAADSASIRELLELRDQIWDHIAESEERNVGQD